MTSTSDASHQDHDNLEVGLILLTVHAQAAGPAEGSWVNRRIDQLEFLGSGAVRWNSSIDFNVPKSAPPVWRGGRLRRIVPVAALPKVDLVAFDLRNERGDSIALPTSREMSDLTCPALVDLARGTLAPIELPVDLAARLGRIVAESPNENMDDYLPFLYVARGLELRSGSTWPQAERPTSREFSAMRQAYLSLTVESQRATSRLVRDEVFFGLLGQLRNNFIACVEIAGKPGTRRIIKLSYERRIAAWSDVPFMRRISGWGCWPFTVLIGGTGGSHHLEVAAPPGVDVVDILAQPTDPISGTEGTSSSRGFTPHVHIRLPGSPALRSRATIRIRTCRPGWADACALAVAGIATAICLGRLNVGTLTGSADEAGTAAVVLLVS